MEANIQGILNQCHQSFHRKGKRITASNTTIHQVLQSEATVDNAIPDFITKNCIGKLH